MSKAYLGIGGNIGDRKANIQKALELLKQHDKINILKVSSIYETEPVGYAEQDWFYNIAAEIDTTLDPYELLEHCNKVEKELKRERLIRWGPRTIDIDILLYEDVKLDESKLTIPHPRMAERAFVMIPLSEIAPDIKIESRSISDIINNLKGEKIRRVL